MNNKRKSTGTKYSKYILFLFIVLISFNDASAIPSERSVARNKDESRYEITIREDSPLTAHVKARLNVEDKLYMSTNCPNYDYPEGWSSFVRDLKITSQNKNLLHKYETKSKWTLESPQSDMVLVEYNVDLSFTKIKWDVGNEQAGHFDGRAVYIVSKALFIHGGEDESFQIRFDIPDTWEISVPWLETKEKNTFIAPNLEFLLENSLVFGKYSRSSVIKNGFQFEFALLGEAAESSKLFDEAFTRIVREFLDIFPKTPPSKFLVTMFYSTQDDGESFYNSNAFTLSKRLNSDGSIIWANQMAHELFHYWSSDLIKAASYEDRQWFSEGFAEYYANLTLLRTGLIDEPTFRSKSEKILGLYLNFKWRNADVTLKDAGKSKGKNRFAVYNGGWAAALALDLLIIEKTKGRKNLDDFMRKMFEKYTETSYEYEDLVATASEVAGEDISGFFRSYVDGKEAIPIEENLNKIGYKVYGVIYEAEMYLIPQKPTGLRELWLRKKPVT
ncbi:MAG: hypothetical protein OEM82_02690 [Acidobacteriota bacterium]|nr:hypothetical protein [Acidobacteriota bacterium]MDH3528943.1 hypothetical protein [Acidobacteriota bacterium]